MVATASKSCPVRAPPPSQREADERSAGLGMRLQEVKAGADATAVEIKSRTAAILEAMEQSLQIQIDRLEKRSTGLSADMI